MPRAGTRLGRNPSLRATERWPRRWLAGSWELLGGAISLPHSTCFIPPGECLRATCIRGDRERTISQTHAALNIGSRGASWKSVRPQTPYPPCDSRGRRRSRTRPPSAIKAVADHPVVVAEEDLDWTRNFVLDAVSQRVQAIV